MQCAESLRVQAYFDREVDAVSATEIERHTQHCSECRALLEDIGSTRTTLRRKIPYVAAPPALRAQILRALDLESAADQGAQTVTPVATAPVAPKPRPAARPVHAPRWGGRAFWTGAFSGMGGAALAAALAFFLVVPVVMNPLPDDLVSAHVRSLMPDHLIDVVSTDKHTVKPWFAGHTDVSPVVADFEAQGYKLIGGRADYIDHYRSAVVVYQHGSHFINVFTWGGAERRLPANTTRSGYHMAFWQEGDIQYCAVSDTSWDELLGLVRLMREQA